MTPLILCEHDRGWIEALIDSEGYLFIRKSVIKKDYAHVRKGTVRYVVGLRITNTCKDLLEKAKQIIGSGAIYPTDYPSWKKRFPKNKLTYRLEIESRPAIRNLLKSIKLIAKEEHRKAMLEFLDAIENRPKGVSLKNLQSIFDPYVDRMKKLNRRGVSPSL